MRAALAEGVFAFWQLALADIIAEWEELSDPANLQPAVRRLNREVAAFLRANRAAETDATQLARALDILEAPWPRREEALLREELRSGSGPAAARGTRLMELIFATGLEPFEPPAPLPPVTASDVRLVCWMALEAR